MRTETVTTIDLGYEQMFVLDGGRDGRVRVLYGATWLTEEGQAADAILRAGEETALHGGTAVVEALQPTRLQLIDRRSAFGRAAQGLRRFGRALRQRLTRLQLGAPAAQGEG